MGAWVACGGYVLLLVAEIVAEVKEGSVSAKEFLTGALNIAFWWAFALMLVGWLVVVIVAFALAAVRYLIVRYL
ncbi:hypothetical protein GCM10007304_35190 [Rhodococcoides trifolii]|uniref:Uncharacterized protein n=1 Tax=Rhodococcoides trifolii TaxID=908250 RepID=A0A917LFG4_9NOCA|nr:hypothetical protein GCM10007304_35190 [Rhodococcus trifolii]